MPASAGWSALFLPAPSPGQIIRYLERRRRAGEAVPDGLLLSDAVRPEGLRVLIGPYDEAVRDWMRRAGPILSEALAGRVAFLSFEGGASAIWEGTTWEKGTAGAAASSQSAATAPVLPSWQRWLERLAPRTKGRPAQELPLAVAWAHRQRLPFDRIPVLSAQPLPLVDYVTVARLDQKSLLVEDSPRLYRFDLPAVSATTRVSPNS